MHQSTPLSPNSCFSQISAVQLADLDTNDPIGSDDEEACLPEIKVNFCPSVHPSIANNIFEAPSSLYVIDSTGNSVPLNQRGLFVANCIIPENTIIGVFSGEVINSAEWANRRTNGRGGYGIKTGTNTILDCYNSRGGASAINTARGATDAEGNLRYNNSSLLVSQGQAYVRTRHTIDASNTMVELLYPYNHRDPFPIQPGVDSSYLSLASLTTPLHHFITTPPPPSNNSFNSPPPLINMTHDPPLSQHTIYDDSDGDTDSDNSTIAPMDDDGNDPIMVGIIQPTTQQKAIDQVIGRSGEVGIRGIFNNSIHEITSPSIPPTADESDLEVSVRLHEDKIRYRQLFAATIETHLLMDSSNLKVKQRVLGGGWCGLAALFIATMPPEDHQQFIITSINPVREVIRSITRELRRRSPMALTAAFESLPPHEYQRFQQFLHHYTQRGDSGSTNISSDLWPSPHHLAPLAGMPIAFWIQEELHEMCYLQVGDIYNDYSHRLEALYQITPDLGSTPQIKLEDLHYEPIHSVAIRQVDVRKAFVRLADRTRAILMDPPNQTGHHSS